MAKPIPKLGRPVAFSDPQELLDWFMDYVYEEIEAERLINEAGFRRNKMIPRSTYNDYERKEAFSDAFCMIEDIMHDETINNKSIDPSTKKLRLQTKFGYVDRSQSKNENDNTNKNIEISNMSMEEKKEWMRKYLSGS